MKANPGGQIDLKQVVGRAELIQALWESVEQQSLVITAERRIGKTTVIKKMSQEPRPGWVPVFQDLEGYHTAGQFALGVYHQIDQFLGRRGKTTRRAKELLAALGGVEIHGLFKLPEKAAPHWKAVLTQSVEDLIQENDGPHSRLLFLWDEVPLMLANVLACEGERTAMELLDVLRALRQTHGRLRMVITGSIGLHHVITSLKEKSYANSPVNDCLPIEVPPLAERHAIQLASSLLEGEGISGLEGAAAAATIAREADGFPFYIHHIVKALKMRDLEATPAQVKAVVNTQLVAANDPWELLHYRERIPLYYRQEETTVLLILDELAACPGTMPVNQLLARLKAASTFDNRERLLQLLSLLGRDHYLQKDADGHHGFKFPLLRRWWTLHRGL